MNNQTASDTERTCSNTGVRLSGLRGAAHLNGRDGVIRGRAVQVDPR